jgi:hypothetical protein
MAAMDSIASEGEPRQAAVGAEAHAEGAAEDGAELGAAEPAGGGGLGDGGAVGEIGVDEVERGHDAAEVVAAQAEPGMGTVRWHPTARQ